MAKQCFYKSSVWCSDDLPCTCENYPLPSSTPPKAREIDWDELKSRWVLFNRNIESIEDGMSIWNWLAIQPEFMKGETK